MAVKARFRRRAGACGCSTGRRSRRRTPTSRPEGPKGCFRGAQLSLTPAAHAEPSRLAAKARRGPNTTRRWRRWRKRPRSGRRRRRRCSPKPARAQSPLPSPSRRKPPQPPGEDAGQAPLASWRSVETYVRQAHDLAAGGARPWPPSGARRHPSSTRSLGEGGVPDRRTERLPAPSASATQAGEDIDRALGSMDSRVPTASASGARRSPLARLEALAAVHRVQVAPGAAPLTGDPWRRRRRPREPESGRRLCRPLAIVAAAVVVLGQPTKIPGLSRRCRTISLTSWAICSSCVPHPESGRRSSLLTGLTPVLRCWLS